MRIIYNGIDLYAIETHQYDMECVMDDTQTDYLFTKHTIVVRAIVAGAAAVFAGWIDPAGVWHRNGPAVTYSMSSGLSGPVGGPVPGTTPTGVAPAPSAAPVGPPPLGTTTRTNPVNPVPAAPAPGVGTMPPTPSLSAGNGNQLFSVTSAPFAPTTTIAAIRHRLTTPRGQLFIFSGDWDRPAGAAGGAGGPAPVMLASPSPGFRCDCKNGPIPRILSIPQVFGDATTFILDFAVETYINESAQNGVLSPGILLSNRFKQRHIIDDNGYTTIATEGMALFRTDLVYSRPYSPDQERPLLMLPIPRGFVREGIVVEGIPSVAGVVYSFQDRQVPVNFTAGPFVKAAKISAVHRQVAINDDNVLKGALSTYERFLGIAANKNIASTKPDRSGVVTATAGAATARPRSSRGYGRRTARP